MCDVAAVTETWLSKAVDSTAIQIDGYTLHRNDRSGRRGGGITVCVKERYNSSILLTANSHSGKLLGHELMWLRISKNAQIYIFGLVYHPPKPIYDSHDFTVKLFNDIDELSCIFPQATFYITGNFNRLDITKQSIDAGLTQIVQSTTHGRHTLDLFLTNREYIVSCTVVKPWLNTDHLTVMVNCVTSCSISTDRNRTQRRQYV